MKFYVHIQTNKYKDLICDTSNLITELFKKILNTKHIDAMKFNKNWGQDGQNQVLFLNFTLYNLVL